jgi:ankyrin repeat protein
LLLAFGADPNQRGINDYTPLHMAVAERNTVAVQTLLDGGANPELRTRIDECETPLEMAEADIRSLRRCWRAKASRFAQPRH